MAKRVAEIQAALLKRTVEAWSISANIALTADERCWLNEHFLPLYEARMAPGTPDAIYKRLRQFSFGFGQLRSLDGTTTEGTILNWQEAVEDAPLLAVDQACRAWNKNGFAWQKTGLIPNPDELARAVHETVAALRAEELNIRRALAAPVAAPEPMRALPAPGRPVTVADAVAELKAAIAGSKVDLGEGDVRRPTTREYSPAYLDDLRAREARRLEREQSDVSLSNYGQIIASSPSTEKVI